MWLILDLCFWEGHAARDSGEVKVVEVSYKSVLSAQVKVGRKHNCRTC